MAVGQTGVVAGLPDGSASLGLLGRVVELHRLGTLSRAGASCLVVVVGEAGIGKSALVNAFAAERRRSGVRVLWGAADVSRSGRFEVLRQPARALGIALPDADASVGPSEQEWELTDLLVAALLDVGSGLVVLEDLHWADGSSCEVIAALSARLVGSGVTLLGTARDEPQSGVELSDRLLRCGEVLRLGPLDDAGIAGLVERKQLLHRQYT
jgi:ATP/maltotriose-dependent transcriptional regulator MalT